MSSLLFLFCTAFAWIIQFSLEHSQDYLSGVICFLLGKLLLKSITLLSKFSIKQGSRSTLLRSITQYIYCFDYASGIVKVPVRPYLTRARFSIG